MTRQFMIHKHPHVITATEILVKGSTGIGDSVLRFNSLDELVGHFTGLGASVEDLKEIQQNVNSTGMAALLVSEKPKA